MTPRTPMAPRAFRDQRGMVGKIVVIWLVVLALLIVVALDAGSIMVTKFRLSEVAADAASDAANSWAKDHNTTAACAVAVATAEEEDPKAQIPKGGCRIDASSGEVTLTLKKLAGTILAGRLSFTRDLARVTQKQTNGPTTL